MSKKEKLLERFKTFPSDFTWDEMKSLLIGLGFELHNKGKTSGSRISFINDKKKTIMLHKPHPGNIMKIYALKQVHDYLKNENLI